MKKLYISKTLGLDPDKVITVADFVNFCRDRLPIESDKMKIYLVDNRKDYNIGTTAYYSPQDQVIAIYCKNRALVDILRSIAHEMTHMMQDETGLITGPVQDVGGFHEDQANSKAGEIIKLYAQSKPERKRIYEALRGNILSKKI